MRGQLFDGSFYFYMIGILVSLCIGCATPTKPNPINQGYVSIGLSKLLKLDILIADMKQISWLHAHFP
jgi:hypothetical protein